MASSKDEILNEFKPLIDMGLVGIIADLQEDTGCKVIYNKMATLDKVLSTKEFWRLQPSQKEHEAIKSGCKTEEEIIEYCNKYADVKKEEAIRTGKVVICNVIGMFSCKDSYEDCSWDMVHEVVTPNGNILYIRLHCY
jgi:hypothetical protein